MNFARLVMQRCDALGKISDEPGHLTRTFASPAMRRASKLVGSWMRDAGLQVRQDAALNLLGRWNSAKPGAKTLLLGSHLDTVRDAGKYDGPLGVLTAIAAVKVLRERGVKLPFNLEVVGFSDEEGVRYQTACLGSGAFAGTLTAADLAQIKEKQIVKARRPHGEFFGYAEVHIEQGPVLEAEKVDIGVVEKIAAPSTLRLQLTGAGGHAGGTLMPGRRDALLAGAEIALAVEKAATTCGSPDTVGTTGIFRIEPGAVNSVPCRAHLEIDLRDTQVQTRDAALRAN